MGIKQAIATTKEQRQAYVTEHMGLYWDFLTEIDNGPYDSIAKMEFAAISANTSMQSAIDGFMASRDKVGVTETGEALHFWGVNAPFVKAAYVLGIREVPSHMIPNPDADIREQRELYVPEIKGLGYAKYSFAASLIAPFESQIVCIDTHMYQTLTGKLPNRPGDPTTNVYGQSKPCLRRYVELENILRGESEESNAPLFLYQWAVWDLQRKLSQSSPIETHDFLWERGREHYQMTLDGLELAS